MDLTYGSEYEAYRDDVCRFLAENWRAASDGSMPEASVFRKLATEAGYLYRMVPREYGGSGQGTDALKARIIREEFVRAGAPLEIRSLGTELLVPTLLDRGAEWQRARFVPPTVSGEIIWCQGYSEPGAGSDLASLSTRAVLVGDEWVINGQKVWTSMAHEADYMFLLARTEPDVPKHKGISYLLVPMDQKGVEVRPLRQMTGECEFNEVFLSDARTPASWIVGERGQGWAVANTTLKHERAWVGDVAQSEQLLNSVVRLAQRTMRDGRPAIEDPMVRQQLAEVQGWVEAHRFSGYVQLSRRLKGENAGVLSLLNKLSNTETAARIAAIAIDLLGDASLLPHTGPGRGAPVGSERWMFQFFGSIGSAIAGGSSNIQRNIIAERGLQLPRDPRVGER